MATKIRKMNKVEQPKHLLFFDTESNIHDEIDNKEYHDLRLGVCIYVQLNRKCEVTKRYVYYFKTSDEFWTFAERFAPPDNILWIIAHNVRYDLANVDVIDQLHKRNWKVPFPIMKNAFILSCHKGRKQYKIIDTLNFVKAKLEIIGEKLGLKKLKIDFKNCEENELFIYCQRDVEICELFITSIIRFLNENKLGSFKPTLAGTAFNVYRTSFMDIPVYYHHNDEQLLLERKAYRGGRVDCFQLGLLDQDKDYYLVDINSMYPFMMNNKELPTKLELDLNNVSVNTIKALSENYYLIGDFHIKCNTEEIGYYALKHEGRLLFPTGYFNIALHHDEILFAIDNNHIKHCTKLYCYKKEKALSEYSIYFSNLKREATNPIDREIAKLFGNSLYGRFGMRKYKTETNENYGDDRLVGHLPVKIKDQITGKDKWQTYHIWFGQLVHSYSTEDEHVNNTNIALAGAVTAYARMYLLQLILEAGTEHVYYCDTDSLLLDKIGYERLLYLMDDKELGKLKLEGVFNKVEIYAPKNYKMLARKDIKRITFSTAERRFCKLQKRIFNDKKIRSKGIPLGVQASSDGSYEFFRFTTFIDYLTKDGFKGRVKVRKQNQLIYKKGHVLENNRVVPYRMTICQNKNKIQKMTVTKLNKMNRRITKTTITELRTN